MIKDLFHSGPFEYKMGLRKCKPVYFFRPHPNDDYLISLRTAIIATNKFRYCGLGSEGWDPFEEFNGLLRSWGTGYAKEPLDVAELGEAIAPDFMLIKDGALVGGSVCFPSSWAFEEKFGKPIDVIHAPVPTLNDKFAPRISAVLNKIPKGEGWARNNWGLSADDRLNHHPALSGLQALNESSDPARAFLRVENQVIAPLPKTKSSVFGIRVKTHPLPLVAEDNEARTGLIKSLETMSDEIAKYKNILNAKQSIINYLKGYKTTS